jgi:1-acyl-sn-glycerol-3-phosphate acyltransferase
MKRPRIDFLYRSGRFLAQIFLPTFGSITVEGRENVPLSGPLLIASNHQSLADPAVLIYAIDRPMWWMAKRSLFKGWLASWFLRQVHVFGVNRQKQDLGALAHTQKLLDQGRALLIFPEGTRHPGALGKGHDGIAYMALRTGVPVIPVAITGTERIPHIWRTPIHFQNLKAVIGKPFTLTQSGRVDRQMLVGMTDRIMRSIAELLPPEYQGDYADDLGESRGLSSERA